MTRTSVYTTMQTYARQIGVVLAFAIVTLGALFFIEGVPGRFATQETYAWRCEDMTASPATIVAGESSTLAWQFGADGSITVTIDELSGQSWDGVTGSTEVYPSESTTYTARAHKAGSDKTYTCSVRVSVEAPPAEVDCDASTITIDDTSFTWSGVPSMERYTVTYCDGDTTGVVDGCWADTPISIDLPKRIKSVTADGGICHKEVTQSCPSIPEEPEWPACPFTEDADTTVVEFDGKGLVANGATADAQSGLYAVALSAGTYTLESASWDGYSWRAGDEAQPYEQWVLNVRDAAGTIYTSPATSDLTDGVVSSFMIDTLSSNLVLSRPATTLQAQHAKYPYDSRESVQPVCVAFTKHEPSYDPWCSMGVSPSTIDRGSATTLWWDSNDVSRVDIPGIGTGLAPDSAVSVSPNISTTYTGSFYADDGSVHTCSAEVIVRTPSDNPTPVCSMNVSTSRVNRGGQAVLSWTSDYATNVTIDQGIGSVPLDGDRSVKVYENTTYTGTFTADNGTSVTCSARVSITGGGGGSCLNCGDDEKPRDKPKDTPTDRAPFSPSVVLTKTITNTGNAVRLDQVPYTGFEAGPLLTMFFWFMVLAASTGIAYVVTYVHPIDALRKAMAQNRGEHEARAREAQVSSVVEDVLHAMHAHPSVSTPAVTAPIAVSVAPVHTSATSLEDRAHEDSILLSPEATRLITDHMARAGGDEHTLPQKIFDLAKDTYPREDGWILLSKERAVALLARSTPGVAGQNTVRTDSVPSEQSVRSVPPVLRHMTADTVTHVTPSPVTHPATDKQNGSDELALLDFVEHIVAGEQQKVYDILRGMTGKGVAPEAFIAQLVRKLDDIYKNRLEGNHNPDPALAAKTATWSNGDFEKVLGILVECVDYSYSSTRIGTKVALTKAFEYFASKK